MVIEVQNKVTTIKKAIDVFLLNCKVEGKSYGTIECYQDKLKGFLWYATSYHWPDDIGAITTYHLREFLAYLRETPHRFNSTCPRAMKPLNSTTIQKYYRALSSMYNFLVRDEVLETSPLIKIQVPRAEKKVIKALSRAEVNQVIIALRDTFEGRRNKAIIALLTESGLRLSELCGIRECDIHWDESTVRVMGKGMKEALAPFGNMSEGYLKKWLSEHSSSRGNIWGINKWGITAMLRRLEYRTGITCNPHTFRRTFACLLRKAGLDSMTIKDLGRWESLEMVQRYTRSITFSDCMRMYREVVGEKV